jgi:hypothetical protein
MANKAHEILTIPQLERERRGAFGLSATTSVGATKREPQTSLHEDPLRARVWGYLTMGEMNMPEAVVSSFRKRTMSLHRSKGDCHEEAQ